VAVADMFDAMTSDRPYRKSVSREVAVNELKRYASTQFDPQVVNAFIETMSETPASSPAKTQAHR
jgi:HD-GYP domain-containing protein (c-di-GMP phosphodiesterase class II)